MSYTEALKVAAGMLPMYFKLFRGSINIRVKIDPIQVEPHQNLSAVDFNLSIRMEGIHPGLAPFGRIDGASHFSPGEEASITVPYLEKTFTSPYDILEDKQIILEAHNYNVSDMIFMMRTYLAVGDDFHTGMFIGSPQTALPTKQSVTWNQVARRSVLS